MSWQMYQLFYSEASELRPGPRFRLLRDALSHAARHMQGKSFAIRTPEGTWHRGDDGRAIFGRGGSGSHELPPMHADNLAIPSFVDDEEDTQPFGTGSGSHRTSESHKRRVVGTGPVHKLDETDTDWPPD